MATQNAVNRDDRTPFRVIVLSVLLIVALVTLAVTVIRGLETQPPIVIESVTLRQELHAVSIIYGKVGGKCDDYRLAEMTARVAMEAGVDAGLLAAIVAVESTCNHLAISKAGAVGLAQVNVKVWGPEHGDWWLINLFHPQQNLEVAARILKQMVERYGIEKGVERYCGAGPEARAYAKKVMRLWRGR